MPEETETTAYLPCAKVAAACVDAIDAIMHERILLHDLLVDASRARNARLGVFVRSGDSSLHKLSVEELTIEADYKSYEFEQLSKIRDLACASMDSSKKVRMSVVHNDFKLFKEHYNGDN